ncbi:hypothetical protein OS493_018469 [Desmophyllum pertusum]|uniref:Uncharacterized protein n=1 Tax=Desmophyllum pertusum TaxID=174260 RepID=A0A9X0DAZ9_9CNID|nr:hypothetical protein OS493_018469 [Desmophyllum pertusum]
MAFDYACERDCSGTESPELVELKAHVDAAATDIAEIMNSKGFCKFTRYSTIYTKPTKKLYPAKCGPSLPTAASVEPGPKKWTIADLKMDNSLNPTSKENKVRQTTTEMMKQIQAICESNGESLGSVLGECSHLTEKENGACEAVTST